ncbi:MAG: carbamoyltransferase C-terminal domain-containing protein [Vicingaceae bacterium]
MYILGINAYHGDSSACLLKDGKLLSASEEERFRRIKHWAGFPSEAIAFCLKDAGISVRELDYVTISRDPKANIHKKILHVFKNKTGLKAILDRLSNSKKVVGVKAQLAAINGIEPAEIKAKLINVEHHRSHLASAFFASPFKKAALLSIDGFGDFTSTMLGRGEDTKMEVMEKVIYPHSIGIFYTSMTQFLGFPNYGDEYKVMGLAPYGEPKYVDQLKEVIRILPKGLFELDLRYFLHAKEGVSMSWESGSPHIGTIFSKELENLLWKARAEGDPLEQKHKDLAASVQRWTEEIIFHLLNRLHKQTGIDQLCVAGGVAQNSVANGKMLARTPFKELYIPSAGHDAGTAYGAALDLYHEVLGNSRNPAVYNAYTGSHFSNEEISEYLKEKKITYQMLEDKALVKAVAEKLEQGAVVGWFQGRAEFGPRALGHRSILVDPRRADAKDLLNEKIKRRESFRPFAPSILEEYVGEYFTITDKVPFMEKVFPIRPEKHAEIPAVTHVDGTGRLQTVIKGDKYYDLIEAFRQKTGTPILLNTSFNENEPIVNTPAEALDCYLRTKMDVLVLENCMIIREV